jgi:hypothetical protein
MLNTFYKTVFERSFARLWAQADGTGESMMVFLGDRTNPNQFWVQRSAQAEPLVADIFPKHQNSELPDSSKTVSFQILPKHQNSELPDSSKTVRTVLWSQSLCHAPTGTPFVVTSCRQGAHLGFRV